MLLDSVLVLCLSCLPIVVLSKRYYEIAILIDQNPKDEFHKFLLKNAQEFSLKITAESPSHPVVSLWNPVFTRGCPHESRNPNRFQNPEFPGTNWPYWRGIALAQKSIWEDFCIYRENVSPDDVIVIFEHDFWCVSNNCTHALEAAVQLMYTDIKLLGWQLCHGPCKHQYRMPLTMHAYAISCAAIDKSRNYWDPCGSAFDLQLGMRLKEGLLSWDIASAEFNAFGINQTALNQVDTNTTFPLKCEGLFVQIENRKTFGHDHTKPGETKYRPEHGEAEAADEVVSNVTFSLVANTTTSR